MALVEKYVDPDAAGTGSGDSAANAYTSQNVFASLDIDCVTATDNYICHCDASSGGDDAVKATYSGWVTSSAYDVVVQVDDANRTPGIWDGANYALSVDSGAGGSAILLQDPYITIDGLQVERTTIYGANGIQFNDSNCTVKNCVIRSSTTGAMSGILYSTAGTGGNTSENNVIYDCTRGIYHSAEGGNSDVYNNTVRDCDTGIEGKWQNYLICKNNLVDGGTTCYASTFNSASDYNAASDATSTGGSNDQINQTFTFVDAANDDFHLASGDTGARGLGVGPATDSNVPTTDVDGDSRSGTTCDIGFDEVAVSGTTYPITATITASSTVTQTDNATFAKSATVTAIGTITQTLQQVLGLSATMTATAIATKLKKHFFTGTITATGLTSKQKLHRLVPIAITATGVVTEENVSTVKVSASVIAISIITTIAARLYQLTFAVTGVALLSLVQVYIPFAPFVGKAIVRNFNRMLGRNISG